MIIVTDSTADIRGEEIEALRIKVVPLTVSFGQKLYKDSVDLMPNEFYEMLKKEKELPTTSQPSPSLFEEIFLEAKQKSEEVLYLAVSSGLSGTINSARIAKSLVDYDRITIIDTLESIQGLRILVLTACKMRDEGKSLFEISEKIEYLKHHVMIFSMIDTLEYLSKGGRLSKAQAILGTVMGIKPLIDLDSNGKIRMYSKTIGPQRALKHILKSISENEIDLNYPVCFGYTYGQDNLQKLMDKVLVEYDIKNYDITQIGPAIGTHIGQGGFCMMYISSSKRK